MTPGEMLKAADDTGSVIVVTGSGRLYHVDEEVLRDSFREPDPYIYGHPVKKHPHRTKDTYWFYARNVRLAEPDDQVNI